MTEANAIANYQPLLMQIALKFVGSIADAEDIVQDTFLKWLTTNREKIENTKAYLVKSVVNNCMNHINALKRKKPERLQNLQPSDLIDWYREKEFWKFDMDVEIASALSVMQKKLEPIERGIFMMRELFDVEYEELQHIFDKKKDNCRKLFSRAKKKLSDDAEKIKLDFENTSFLESFRKACNSGAPGELIAHIKKDVK